MKPTSLPSAVLVMDMVNDFVTGVFGSGVPVIYCCDSHLAGIAAELRVHPDHAIRDTWRAEIISEFTSTPDDYVVCTRRYSAFFGTAAEVEIELLLGRSAQKAALNV